MYLFWGVLWWVFIAACRLSLVAGSGGYSSLWGMGSRHEGFSSCSSQAQLLQGMWNLPGPGMELVRLALQGRFLTTRPPGKPSSLCFYPTSLGPLLRLINTAYYSHFLYQSLTYLKTGSLFIYVAPTAVSKVSQVYLSSHTILYFLFTI